MAANAACYQFLYKICITFDSQLWAMTGQADLAPGQKLQQTPL